jgi:DNA-nicking Smr family endonuclease
MSFKDIYSQWESSHDEEKAIQKRMASSQSEDPQDNSLTINTVRRMNAQDELDLHGCKFEDAVPAAVDFINASSSKGLRKIRIITGKGLHSPGGKSIIRPEIVNAVRNHPAVREADFNPKARDGGSGAIIIILKSKV